MNRRLDQTDFDNIRAMVTKGFVHGADTLRLLDEIKLLKEELELVKARESAGAARPPRQPTPK
jgi:hypothetical protein